MIIVQISYCALHTCIFCPNSFLVTKFDILWIWKNFWMVRENFCMLEKFYTFSCSLEIPHLALCCWYYGLAFHSNFAFLRCYRTARSGLVRAFTKNVWNSDHQKGEYKLAIQCTPCTHLKSQHCLSAVKAK